MEKSACRRDSMRRYNLREADGGAHPPRLFRSVEVFWQERQREDANALVQKRLGFLCRRLPAKRPLRPITIRDLADLLREAGAHVLGHSEHIMPKGPDLGLELLLLVVDKRDLPRGVRLDFYVPRITWVRPERGGHDGLVHINGSANRADETAARALFVEAGGVSEPAFELMAVAAIQGVFDHRAKSARRRSSSPLASSSCSSSEPPICLS